MSQSHNDRSAERRMRQAWGRAQTAAAARWPAADSGRHRSFTALLALTAAREWRLLVNRRWDGEGSAKVTGAAPEAVLVGPPGIYVLAHGDREAAPELVRNATLVESVVQREAEVSGSAVHPLLVVPDGSSTSGVADVRCVTEGSLIALLNNERPRVFPPRLTRALAADVSGGLTVLREEQLPEPPESADESTVPAQREPDEGLFSTAEVRNEEHARAMRAPIENWMTYLASHQLPMVRRQWNGPARISGPAGTGKTVVGLHRAAYLAERTSGHVLYVTYANNLPRVQETFLRTMSPSVCDRVDFLSLYKFVLGILRERNVPYRLDTSKVDSCFFRAWSKVSREEHWQLREFDRSGYYWRDEIEHVIKGRGLTTLNAYLAVPRRGRGALPPGVTRAMVWRLYRAYQDNLAEYGVHDFHDVLGFALAELRRDPQLDTQYTSVVVDEAQDLPFLGVQLLHELVGDRPNGLLLIGDGQQNVYPGGFRLSEAGIDVRGDRGQVLRKNYRNAPQVLNAALGVVSDVPYLDLDGSLGHGARDVEFDCPDGAVREAHFADLAEHDRALVDELRELAPAVLSGAAVLAPSRDDERHYRRLLEQHAIPVCPLDEYHGAAVEAVKLGGYIRAKGLDFTRVYLPLYDRRLTSDLDRSRLFVAMTRARDHVWLGSVRSGG